MATMKAIRIHAYGGPEVLEYEDAPRPEPGSGEILVRVHAAGINPVDWKIRAGHLKDYLHYQLPWILGWDLSGTVEACGPGVTGWEWGDEVYSRPDIARNGAYAQYITVRPSEIAAKPKTIDHIHSAAIPLAGLTAWQALFDTGGLQAGQRVLIHAAAGGVGTFAVQFAKNKGAYVIGTASGRNQAFLKELGVDQPINYETQRFEDVVHDVDLVLDTLSGDTQTRSWKVLKPGGILVSILNQPSAEQANAHRVRTGYVFVQPNSSQLAEIAQLVDAGKVKPIVETILPLAETRKAHELNETGHTRGKIVLRVV